MGTNGNFTSNTGHFSTDALGVTLYGSVTPLPNLFVDGTVGYTLRDYDTVRRASYSNALNGIGVDGFVQGNTTGNEFRTSVQAGYDFPWAPSRWDHASESTTAPTTSVPTPNTT